MISFYQYDCVMFFMWKSINKLSNAYYSIIVSCTHGVVCTVHDMLWQYESVIFLCEKTVFY